MRKWGLLLTLVMLFQMILLSQAIVSSQNSNKHDVHFVNDGPIIDAFYEILPPNSWDSMERYSVFNGISGAPCYSS